MKRLFRRYTLLLLLVCAALMWVALLSIPFGQFGETRAADGATGRWMRIDESTFPSITAYAALLDNAGQPISDLQRENFTLTEDGIPVDWTFTGAGEQPLTAMLVLDRSGSMDEENKMAGAQTAAQTFIDLLRPGRDTLGLMAFSTDIETLLPLDMLATSSDQRAASELVERIRPDGATRLNDAIIEAVDDMEGATGRQVIIALTDGISKDDSSSARDTIERAVAADIPVYTIGLGSDVDTDQLQEIAEETGGEYFFAPGADQLAALYGDLARALQNEYSFTYTSPTPRLDGTRRTLALDVERPGGAFAVNDDYAVSGVLVLDRSPWLLVGLGGTLVALMLVPSLLRRRALAPAGTAKMPAAIPEQAAVPVVVAPHGEAVPVARHPYRAPLVEPEAPAAHAPTRSFTVMLRNERTTIGSEQSNDVVLPGLAPHHAAITRQDGRWVVAPAGGEIRVAYNGTTSAERPVAGTNAIKHGSVIRFGAIRAIFQANDQPELVIEGL